MPAIIGTKVGMTQLFEEDGSVVPVTVIEAGPCPVTAVRKPDRDGYSAVQLAWGKVKARKLNRPELGHLERAGAEPHKHLVEFRDLEGEHQIGTSITVESFEAGQRVSVSGTSKGKGFAGTIKRHNFKRGPASHGSHNVRAPGSIGAAADPARVFPGQKMPGQMGNKRRTQPGLRLVRVDADRNLLMVEGSVPGAAGGVLEVRG
ncbi:MAG: 50S ribosomal protein L3 [Solirubrobacterales bacterium]